MERNDIINAYLTIRKENHTIPDYVLDFMKFASLEKFDEFNKINLNTLGERKYDLISSAINTLGTYNPNEILPFFEEKLYSDEVKEIKDFLQWCYDNDKKFGRINYEEVFRKYKSQRS